MRERSIGLSWRRAIRSTASSTAESIPSPSRSILRKPASAQESLSHWQIWRPVMAAGWTGTMSISGRVEITIPPGTPEEVYRVDGAGMRASNALLAWLDGPTVDDGTAAEIGVFAELVASGDPR